ncbi:MAG: hypothetical protein ACKVOH_03610 [Chlamydiales bacterium]
MRPYSLWAYLAWQDVTSSRIASVIHVAGSKILAVTNHVHNHVHNHVRSHAHRTSVHLAHNQNVSLAVRHLNASLAANNLSALHVLRSAAHAAMATENSRM